MRKPELVERLSRRLDAGGATPPSHLIVEELWLAVVEGSLDVGARLPTARQLGIALGISPRSIEHAYAELERRGVLATRAGAGCFVSLTQPSEQDRARHRAFARLCRETVERAAELGFDIDEVRDALAEFRAGSTPSDDPEPEEHRP